MRLRLFPLNDAVDEASALLLRLIFKRNGASAVKHLDAVGELADHPHVVLAKLSPREGLQSATF
jgi:hypothetical protein